MAEDKKSVLVYADWINKFEELTDEEAGKLIKHFFRYVNDLNPEAPDRTTKLMFIDIQNTLKRDLKKYKIKTKERSDAGKLGNLKKYNPDLFEAVERGEQSLELALEVAKYRKRSHSDAKDRIASQPLAKLAVSDSDSVSDSDTITKGEKLGVVDYSYIKEFSLEIGTNAHEQWRDSFYMGNKIKNGGLSKLLQVFEIHCKEFSIEKHKNINKFKSHFSSWVKLEMNKGNLTDFKRK